MVAFAIRRGIASSAALLAAAGSLATITATPSAAAQTGTTFHAGKYGTVVMSSLPPAPNAQPATTTVSRHSAAPAGATPAFNTLNANDLEQQTSAPAYKNKVRGPWNTPLARSATQLVESVGSDLRVLDSSGRVLRTVTMASFWKTPATNFPETDDVVFDASAGRFYMVGDRSASARSQITFAVSNTSNATGSWTLYQLITEPDHDRGYVHVRVGFGTNKIVIGYDDVVGSLCMGTCRDGHLMVLQRSDALALQTIRGVDFNTTHGTAHPEFITPAVPVPLQAKGVAYAAYMETNAFGHRAAVYVITGTPASANTAFSELLSGFQDNPNDPSPAREPGGLRVLPGGWDDIAQGRGGIAFEGVSQSQALGGNGAVLWLADNVNCNPGGGTRVCVKLVRVQVNNAGTGLTDTWEHVLAGASGNDFYEPSVVAAPVSGRVFVEYTHSSNALPPRRRDRDVRARGQGHDHEPARGAVRERHEAVQRRPGAPGSRAVGRVVRSWPTIRRSTRCGPRDCRRRARRTPGRARSRSSP